ncbi:MAG: hypothetical protein A2808_03515 [Candidatus Moranbacteria bacterium RIFCSPHIGHO2_01_FULL_55_24]|nr:MAG: hypothetical protein A2808_03515 [Candidatus Moranbacteria bacterium RIFCSPHIGHO2_01_FULL_55_24]
MKHAELKKILSEDKDYRDLINHYDLKYEISELITRARISRGFSQEKLAKLIKSKQPNIARLENASALPSLSTLEKIAKAFDSYLIAPKFAFLEEEDNHAKETLKTVRAWAIEPDVLAHTHRRLFPINANISFTPSPINNPAS